MKLAHCGAVLLLYDRSLESKTVKWCACVTLNEAIHGESQDRSGLFFSGKNAILISTGAWLFVWLEQMLLCSFALGMFGIFVLFKISNQIMNLINLCAFAVSMEKLFPHVRSVTDWIWLPKSSGISKKFFLVGQKRSHQIFSNTLLKKYDMIGEQRHTHFCSLSRTASRNCELADVSQAHQSLSKNTYLFRNLGCYNQWKIRTFFDVFLW